MTTAAQERQKILRTYLNDHLAGAAAALQLLDDMIDEADAPDGAASLTLLRSEIVEDRDVLEHVLHAAGGETSVLRQAGGWMAGKAEQLKLLLDDAGGAFGRLQRLEALSLGIVGKRALWRALRAASIPAPAGGDFAQLEARAGQQYERVEEFRIEAARRALAV